MRDSFEFINFVPTESLESFAKERFAQIIDLAPSSASTEGVIEKSGSGYKCHLEIYSEGEPFVADGTGEYPQSAVEKVEEDIMKQLSEWKHKRFA